MAEQELYIKKERTLDKGVDYNFLRSKGIEYIESLASELWTDYNVHDPGITQLEILAYAITDLGYRCNYLIEDILSNGGSDKLNKHFFTARQILTNNPVTENDFRKVLIDVKGIKNAWLEIASEVEHDIFLNCQESKLSLSPLEKRNIEQIKLSGIYNVILELDDDDELGNLNLYCFERTIKRNDKEFNIEIVLPAWNTYFNKTGKPQSYKIENITAIAQSQNYRASFEVKYENETIKKEVLIRSKGLKSADNQSLIENELKRTDKESLLYHYKLMIEKALLIISDAYKILHSTRNLCEDFYLFKAVDVEEIVVCADIEVTSAADLETVLAQIYYDIKNFLAPPVNFYTIKELTERGKKTDEIFNGPILNHGFIDEDELKKSVFKNVIHVSDFIQIIMDIKGVVAVKDIMISNLYNCEPQTEGEKWCLMFKKGRAAKLCVNHSKIVFYKGLVPYSVDKEETLENLDELEKLNRSKHLAKQDYDMPVPKGEDRQIQNYYSIQNDFPLNYGIGIEGLPSSASKERKALAKQLKVYLLFYDQILANFFAQLAHVRDLFSTNPNIKKTYYSHNLFKDEEGNKTNFPNLHYLVKDFVDTLDLKSIDIDDYSIYKTDWETFINNPDNNPSELEREDILESKSTYEDRRNRFLDHLMSRFAEQFTDYVLLMNTIDKKKAPSELINDKINFLSDYDEVSYNRGKAFNYKDPAEIWDTKNVTGLQRRITRLLGINNYERRTLSDCITSSFEIYNEIDTDGIDEYRFRLLDKDGNILLSSTTRYESKEKARKEIQAVISHGVKRNNYEIKKTSDERFHIVLKDDTGEIIARMIKYFDDKDEVKDAVRLIVKYMNDSMLECEGVYLIEHILLRPRTINDRLMKVCVEKSCKSCPGFKDPYSFRVTAVVPYWSERFRNFDFRRYFESTIRMEAPAHVHVKVCWVTKEQMMKFEKVYKDWLKEISKHLPNKNLSKKQNSLVEVLELLRSVYPENKLYDCKNQDELDVILLNHSILGSISEDENDSL